MRIAVGHISADRIVFESHNKDKNVCFFMLAPVIKFKVILTKRLRSPQAACLFFFVVIVPRLSYKYTQHKDKHHLLR